MEVAIIAGLLIQAVIEVFLIVWIFSTARATKLAAERLAPLYTLASDVAQIRNALIDDARAVRTRRSEQVYDEALIPSDRFYVGKKDIAKKLMKAKLATAEQIENARIESDRRGGHFCDHLIALGVVDAEAMAETLLEA